MFRNDPFDWAMRFFLQAVSQTVVRPGLVMFAIGAMIATAPRPGSTAKPKPPRS